MMADHEEPAPRGSTFGDVGMGCLAYISFQLLTAITVATLGVALLRSGGAVAPNAFQGLSSLEKVGGVVMGFVGFAVAFSSSRSARLVGGSLIRRGRVVGASWALLLLVGCAALAVPVLLRPAPPPEPELAKQTLSVLNIDLVTGIRGEWDDDPWEGAVASSSADGVLAQSVSWRHATALTEAGVSATAGASMPLIQAAVGDQLLSTPTLSTIQLSGARANGYTWILSPAGQSPAFLTRVTTWDCPGTSLNVTLTTTGIGEAGVDFVQDAHERSQQGALCLLDAATAAPRRNIEFLGSKKWVKKDVASGGSEQWATKDELSQAMLFTRRSTKLKQILSTGLSCPDILATTAQDAISKQGATAVEPAARRSAPTDDGCTLWVDAQVAVEGTQVPLTTFWELRDCHDGNHLIAGFFTFEPKKFRDPSALWACGDPTEAGGK